MTTYIARRLLLMVPTLLGITLIVFTVMALSPGGISVQSLVSGQNLEPQAKQALEDYYNLRYGLDDPAPLQYLRWLNNISPIGWVYDEQGKRSTFPVLKWPDLGRSFRYGRAVSELLAERVPITLLLNAMAIPIIYLIAIIVGVRSAAQPGSRFDYGSNAFMLALWSVPSMLMGTLLIGFLTSEQYLRWFPTGGLQSRAALNMPFLPHWSDTFDVLLFFVCTISAAVAMFFAAQLGRRVCVGGAVLLSLATFWLYKPQLLVAVDHSASAASEGSRLLYFALAVVVACGAGAIAYLCSAGWRQFSLALLGWIFGACLAMHFALGSFIHGVLLERLWHLILPVFCLSYAGFAFLARLTRSALLENLRAGYARTARAKGLDEAGVLWRHVFRNSLLPLITVSSSLLPGLLAGSLIVESIFSIDGMGKLAIEAVQSRDRELVLSITLISGVLTLVGYLLADIGYSLADPRVSYD